MSKRMSTLRSRNWHQKFGWPAPIPEAPVDSVPYREPLKPVEPMTAKARLDSYAKVLGKDATGLIYIDEMTPKQRRRYFHKEHKAGRLLDEQRNQKGTD